MVAKEIHQNRKRRKLMNAWVAKIKEKKYIFLHLYFWQIYQFVPYGYKFQHIFFRLRLIIISFSFILHCVKSVLIRRYSGPHFPAFGLDTERYSISLLIQFKYGKMRTRITPNTNTFYAVLLTGGWSMNQYEENNYSPVNEVFSDC